METLKPNEEQIFTHGVTKQNKINSHAQLHAEELKITGFTIVKNVLNEIELTEFKKKMDQVYETQLQEVGGEQQLDLCKDRNNIRCLLGYDVHFAELSTKPEILEIAKIILGENIILMMQNGISNVPDESQFQVSWHRDLNFQHWVCSQTLAINALYCIDEFTIENGCTYALPGSHLFEEFPSNEFVKKHEIPLVASAGDVLILNSMMFHRAGFNTSKTIRRAINNVYGKPFMGQQVDIPSMLKGKFKNDPNHSSLFGYKWNPAKSVIDWRKERMRK